MDNVNPVVEIQLCIIKIPEKVSIYLYFSQTMLKNINITIRDISNFHYGVKKA